MLLKGREKLISMVDVTFLASKTRREVSSAFAVFLLLFDEIEETRLNLHY